MATLTSSELAAMRWLDSMPLNKRFPVTSATQKDIICQWMREREFDGGLNFNSDFSEIYKCELIPVSEKWQDKKQVK